MKKKKPAAAVRATLDLRELRLELTRADEERRRVKDLAMQLQDDVIWLHGQLDTLKAQMLGLIRRPRL